MAVELRRASGVCCFTGEFQQHRYDDVIVDGRMIGHSFVGSNKITWVIPKKTIPVSIIKQVVRLCRERNEREEASQSG